MEESEPPCGKIRKMNAEEREERKDVERGLDFSRKVRLTDSSPVLDRNKQRRSPQRKMSLSHDSNRHRDRKEIHSPKRPRSNLSNSNNSPNHPTRIQRSLKNKRMRLQR